jgi:hypothetical protein
MSSDGPFERARHFLEALHLVTWLVSGVIFIVTTVSSYMQGIPIVISVLAGIGAVVVVAAIIAGVHWLVFHQFPRMFGQHVSLSNAATKMYARLERSRYPQQAGITAMRPNEKLQWMVNSLLANRNGAAWRVRFYGRQMPSTVVRPISDDELKRRHWQIGTDTLHEGSPTGATVFDDVAVNRWDLRRHIKSMRIAAGN